MNEIEEIGNMENKLKKLLNYHYKNTGNLKLDIVSSIQNISMEMIKANKYLKKVEWICCSMIYKYNSKLIYIKNILQKLIEEDKEKLSSLIHIILFSKYFRSVFEIDGNINMLEIKLLIKDIEENIFLLIFDKSEDISNYILSYIKKFVKTVS